MPRKPVHDLRVIRRDAKRVSLAVAKNVVRRELKPCAEPRAELGGLPVDGGKITGIREVILTDFKADVFVVGAPAGMPAAPLPRECLVGGDRAVRQSTDKAVDTDLASARKRLIPVIIVSIGAEPPVIGADIAPQPGIIGTRAVHHDALYLDGGSRLIAIIFREKKLIQSHDIFLLLLLFSFFFFPPFCLLPAASGGNLLDNLIGAG